MGTAKAAGGAWRWRAVWMVSLVLAGCGGGGSGGSLDDPLFKDQWHLENTGQSNFASAGEDINVVPAWNEGATGRGVKVTVVDTGVEIDHEDLRSRTDTALDWDFVSNDGDPSPPGGSGFEHGTEVAGLIAAESDNWLGGKGVAHEADIVGVRLLLGDSIPISDMAEAMLVGGDVVGVSNNSWGHADDSIGEVSDPIVQWQDAVALGATVGRDGKGIVYVWAAGNGGEDPFGFALDNSNYDFQANNRHVIAVGAVDGQGVKTFYSEPGANVLVSAPGGTFELGVVTTDMMGADGANDGGYDDEYENPAYTKWFVGTSAATPIVAGVAALILDVNPDLSWRDVRLILAQSARKNDPADDDWVDTRPVSGQPVYHVNHKYGFGVVDAQAAVVLARSWTPVGLRSSESFSTGALNLPIADSGGAGLTTSVTVSSSLVLEHVEVEVNIPHADAGDLEIVLTAPSGTQSVLAQRHSCLGSGAPRCEAQYAPWTFGSVRHLGEAAGGVWQLTVTDKQLNEIAGNLMSWTITVYGR